MYIGEWMIKLFQKCSRGLHSWICCLSFSNGQQSKHVFSERDSLISNSQTIYLYLTILNKFDVLFDTNIKFNNENIKKIHLWKHRRKLCALCNFGEIVFVLTSLEPGYCWNSENTFLLYCPLKRY